MECGVCGAPIGIFAINLGPNFRPNFVPNVGLYFGPNVGLNPRLKGAYWVESQCCRRPAMAREIALWPSPALQILPDLQVRAQPRVSVPVNVRECSISSANSASSADGLM